MKELLLVLLGFAFFSHPLPAAPGTIAVPGAAGGDFTVHVVSQKEARLATTIRQQYDFSCGSAALATLLTFHYDDTVSEEEAFTAMYAAGDHDKIRKDGFSLLDIKNYLKQRGYRADGYKVSLDKLKSLGIPALALINNQGYRHFVVIKGFAGEEILLGDPSLGVRRISRAEFETMWNGLLFLVRDEVDVAKRHFNQQAEWRIYPKAPLALVPGGQDLANITWLLPGKNEF